MSTHSHTIKITRANNNNIIELWKSKEILCIHITERTMPWRINQYTLPIQYTYLYVNSANNSNSHWNWFRYIIIIIMNRWMGFYEYICTWKRTKYDTWNEKKCTRTPNVMNELSFRLLKVTEVRCFVCNSFVLFTFIQGIGKLIGTFGILFLKLIKVSGEIGIDAT